MPRSVVFFLNTRQASRVPRCPKIGRIADRRRKHLAEELGLWLAALPSLGCDSAGCITVMTGLPDLSV